jgi:hypothetical protein
MRLYIRMMNGRPVDHPMVEDNVVSAFPEVDLDNLPDWLARFERVAKPAVGVYEIANGPVYIVENGVVRDQWIVRDMTDDEILIKQNRVKQNWIADGRSPNWVFNEELCCYETPVPYPTTGGPYIWVEQALNWVPIALEPQPLSASMRSPYPKDGNLYKWDEENSTWVIFEDPPEP